VPGEDVRSLLKRTGLDDTGKPNIWLLLYLEPPLRRHVSMRARSANWNRRPVDDPQLGPSRPFHLRYFGFGHTVGKISPKGASKKTVAEKKKKIVYKIYGCWV